MKFKGSAMLFAIVVTLAVVLSYFPVGVLAGTGDNLWISDTAWGALKDPAGKAILPKGDTITIPVTLTSAQGTILVTTQGIGTNDDEKSMPELDGTTGLYKNVVYIDHVSVPTTGSIYNYTFGFDSAVLTKGQKLYVKVGGTDFPAGDNQKATTTYLGAVKPAGNYTAAVDSSDNVMITTPSTTLAVPASTCWSDPKVTLTILSNNTVREISTGAVTTDTSITIPNSALVSAFSDLSLSEMTITNIIVNDRVIEDVTLDHQNIAVKLGTINPTPSAPNVTADDRSNVIVGLDLATMEYAVSADGGSTYGEYVIEPQPFLGGSKAVKIRVRATGETPAGMDAILTFTPNPGDISGDGLIDISDVIMAAEIAVGYSTYTSEQRVRANVSSKTDQTVDISDVVLIAERAVGSVVPFPAEI